jgi:hypothetical protein
MTKYLNWIFPIIFNLDFIKNLDVILNPVIKNWLFIPPFAVCRTSEVSPLKPFAWAENGFLGETRFLCVTQRI